MTAMISAPGRLVARALLRIHRPIALWFWGVMILCAAVVQSVATLVGSSDFPGGAWTLIAGSATRYWMLVIGILLVVLHLRAFVANGITRRDFTLGAAVFGLVCAAGFGVLLLLGHAVETALFDTAGGEPVSYLPTTVGGAAAELGRTVPALAAFLVSGLLIGTAYYRFHPLAATLLIVPSLVPAALAGWTLTVGDIGSMSDVPMPYAAGLALTLTAVVIASLVARRLLGDVAIRRTAG